LGDSAAGGSVPIHADNRYGIFDREMDSDSADDAAYDDAEFALADNSNNADPLYTVSARHATADQNSACGFVSSAISSLATAHLSKYQATIAKPVADTNLAVADSGSTDNMLPDHSAFLSYRRLINRFVTLGDDTRLPILGKGSAKVKLNGKVVILRKCLHVPGLRNPLYSLRKHRKMPGCGTYSDYDHSAFILFLRFTLQIDDSVNNFISYEPIGCSQPNITIDYCKPRNYVPPAARPAAHLSVHYSVPTPKCVRVAAPILRSPIPTSTPIDDAATEPTDTFKISDKELIASTRLPLSPRLLRAIHSDPATLPPVPPYATPAAAGSRTTFDSLKLHRKFGCRRFRNQEHITSASSNAKLINTGVFPSTIGDFATITNPPRGKPIKKRRHFLDKVHMDIVYGDCLSLRGYKYALLLVDVATRYSWMYGLQTLTSTDIITTSEAFISEAGAVPKTFHADFDKKLIGGKALRWIHTNHSRIKAAPASRQSSNGLVEATWKTIVKMARAFITEKQVGREFWFCAVKHDAQSNSWSHGLQASLTF
jgi:hypothetical protein